MIRTFRMLGMMLAVGACVLATSSAFAGPVALPPGSSNVAVPQTDTFADDVGSGYSVTAKYEESLTNGAGMGVTLYVDAVLTAGGTYDFVYQIKNTGTGDVDALSVQNFTNVSGPGGNLAVDGLTDTTPPALTNFADPTSPANAPNTAGRSSTPGAIVTFTFSSTPGQDLQPGQTSALFLIQTNATRIDLSGTVGVSDLTAGTGSVSFNNVPEVSLATVPEPGSLVLGSLALIFGAGVYGFRRRK